MLLVDIERIADQIAASATFPVANLTTRDRELLRGLLVGIVIRVGAADEVPVSEPDQTMFGISAALREKFPLDRIAEHLRIRAAACRRLAAQQADSLAQRNWNGLADELDGDATALDAHVKR